MLTDDNAIKQVNSQHAPVGDDDDVIVTSSTDRCYGNTYVYGLRLKTKALMYAAGVFTI